MTLLRDEIWADVRSVVQEFRLDESAASELSVEACEIVANDAIRRREAHALNETGRMLTDEDLAWMRDQVDALLGAGPIERFLRRPEVENLYVFGPDRAALALTGGRQEHICEPVFAGEEGGFNRSWQHRLVGVRVGVR